MHESTIFPSERRRNRKKSSDSDGTCVRHQQQKTIAFSSCIHVDGVSEREQRSRYSTQSFSIDDGYLRDTKD